MGRLMVVWAPILSISLILDVMEALLGVVDVVHEHDILLIVWIGNARNQMKGFSFSKGFLYVLLIWIAQIVSFKADYFFKIMFYS